MDPAGPGHDPGPGPTVTDTKARAMITPAAAGRYLRLYVRPLVGMLLGIAIFHLAVGARPPMAPDQPPAPALPLSPPHRRAPPLTARDKVVKEACQVHEAIMHAPLQCFPDGVRDLFALVGAHPRIPCADVHTANLEHMAHLARVAGCDRELPFRADLILSDATSRDIYDEVFGPVLAIFYPGLWPFFPDLTTDGDADTYLRAALDQVCCVVPMRCYYSKPLVGRQA